jgi:VanZ family protein
MSRPGSPASGRIALYWLPVFLYVGAIFGLSTIRGGGTPWLFPHMDKLMHLLEYSLFGLLLGRAVRFTLYGSRRFVAAAATLALGATVGALDELYQAHVPTRNSSVADWLTDVAAIGISIILTQVVHVRPLGRPPRAGDPSSTEKHAS